MDFVALVLSVLIFHFVVAAKMKFSPYNQRKLKLQNKLKIHKKNMSEEIDSQLGLSAPL